MTQIPERWAARTIGAGLSAFAATTGALLAFGRGRGGVFAPFKVVGRRVALDIALPAWGDIAVGLTVHLGQSLALGALAVLLAAGRTGVSRLRAALLVVLGWQLATRILWLAAIRADVIVDLSLVARAGMAALLVAALAVGQGE